MEEKVKEIIALFIKVPADQIGPGTPIGRSALQSSILMHRMYARLAETGLLVDNYNDINVYADLWSRQGSGSPDDRPPGTLQTQIAAFPVSTAGEVTEIYRIGVDIEEVAAMPEVQDFRSAEFYQLNFTPGEIAYCILQADPYSSFAGLFAAKEAIVKADAFFRGRPFNALKIDHTPEGKPLSPGFGLSISHAGGLAVAVAVRETVAANGPSAQGSYLAAQDGQPMMQNHRTRSFSWIAWVALLLSIFALVRGLKH
jgi:phosphopantetheinyl transferase (holo-ACP synthase)